MNRFVLALLQAAGVASLSIATGSRSANGKMAKVIQKLKDMQGTLAQDSEEADEAFKKFQCWCKEMAEQQEQLEQNQKLAEDMTALIQKLTAQIAEAKAQEKAAQAESAEASAELASAQEARAKEVKEFKESENDLTTMLSSLVKAIDVLSKHQSFAQLKQAVAMIPAKAAAKNVMSSLLEAPGMTGDVGSQSGQIFGILNQMQEDGELDLRELREDEARNQQAFAEKEAALKNTIALADEAAANANDKALRASEEQAEAVTTKEGALDLIAKLGERLQASDADCRDAAATYETESKLRTEEAAALTDAINVLTSDSAFATTQKVSLVQSRTKFYSSRRLAAMKTLRAAGHHSSAAPNAFLLSMKVKNDTFDKIFKMADEMLATLEATRKTTVEQKEQCDAQTLSLEQGQSAATDAVKELQSQIENFNTQIDSESTTIETESANLADLKTNINDAAAHRSEEASLFQKQVAEQKEFIALLNEATEKLARFYAKRAAAEEATPTSLVQLQKNNNNKKKSVVEDAGSGVAGSSAPEMKAYESQGGNVVIDMLTGFVSNAEESISTFTTGEQEELEAYSDFVEQSNGAVNGMNDQIANAQIAKANAEEGLILSQDSLKTQNGDLASISEALSKTKANCEFVVTEFDHLLSRIDDEIAGINTAVGQLKGQMSLVSKKKNQQQQQAPTAAASLLQKVRKY